VKDCDHRRRVGRNRDGAGGEHGVVLRIGDRIETGLPGRIVYDGVPANLRDGRRW